MDIFLNWVAKVLVFILDLFLGNPSAAATEEKNKKKVQSESPKSGANCHLCSRWVDDAHPKGEFVVCEHCLTLKPSQ